MSSLENSNVDSKQPQTVSNGLIGDYHGSTKLSTSTEDDSVQTEEILNIGGHNKLKVDFETLKNGFDCVDNLQSMPKLNDPNEHQNSNDSKSFNHQIVMDNDENVSKLDEDSFEDFQTAQFGTDESLSISAQPQQHSSHNANPQETFAIENEDEFADFASFSLQEANFANFELNQIKTSDNSCAFVNSNSKDENDEEDDFEDFADFTSMITVDESKIKPTTSVPATANHLRKDYKKSIQKAFNTEKNSDPLNEPQIVISTDFFDPKICPIESINIWNSLQQIDLLKQNFPFDKWRQSKSFKHLLEALKIDNRNVIPPDVFPSRTDVTLPSSSTQATSLSYPMSFDTILQPTVYDCSSTIASKVPSSSTPLTASSLTNPIENLHSANSAFSNLAEKQDIFSSGLNSSEKHSTTAAVIDDMAPRQQNIDSYQGWDLFETKYVKNYNINNESTIFQDDLLAEFDVFSKTSAYIDVESQNQPNSIEKETSKPQIKDDNTINKLHNQNVIQNNDGGDETCTKSWSDNHHKNHRNNNNNNNEQVLSAEALQILTELPNLSMMRANRLLFPFKDTNYN